MFSNWEKKWESFSLQYAKSASENSQTEWGKHFSQICILTSNILLSCVVTHIIEFKLKSKEFQAKKFKKHISSFQFKDYKTLLNYAIIDFMILLTEQKEVRSFLEEYGISDEDFEEELFRCFDFDLTTKTVYFKLKPVSGTLEHSVHLISLLGAASESKNEGLLLGIEYFKKNFFDRLKKHLFSIVSEKK